jgi:hypothetical protein
MVAAAAARAGDASRTWWLISIPWRGPYPVHPGRRGLPGGFPAPLTGSLFLNNPAAMPAPPGHQVCFAGGSVFGHGCYGDEALRPAPATDPTEMQPAHPLTPLDTPTSQSLMRCGRASRMAAR